MQLFRVFDGAVVALLAITGALIPLASSAQNHAPDYLAPVDATIINVATKAHVTVGEDSYEASTSAALGAGIAGGDSSFCRAYPNGAKIPLLVLGGAVFARDKANHPSKLQPAFAEFVEGHQFHRIYLEPEAFMIAPGAPGEALVWHRQSVIPISGKTRFGSPLTYYFIEDNDRMAGFDLTLRDGEGEDYTISVIMDRMVEEDGIPLFTSLQITDRGTLFNYGFHALDLTFKGETPPEFIC